MCALGLPLVPLNVPLLAPKDTAAYSRSLPPVSLVKWDNSASGFPQTLAGRLGWEEMTKAVADVYHVLPIYAAAGSKCRRMNSGS